MAMRPVALCLTVAALAAPPTAEAQFRRGMLGDSTQITLYPHQPPALLLPAGPVELDVRNASSASARIVERVRDILGRQLTENDARLSIVAKGGGLLLTATIVEWNESRRPSTKYVSETRQVGTRQVKDKNGNIKHEPIYEYGRNKPSVVISGAAGLRLEVRRRSGGTPVADETVRHAIQEEVLTEAGPPSRDEVEDRLLDNVIRKGAGRVTPGRAPAYVMLARSDDVDRLNQLAEARQWHDWLRALEALKPHRDKKRDAYRLHNLAVAHEAIGYEAETTEDWTSRMALASSLISGASAQHPGEKYITEAVERITTSSNGYRRLVDLYASAGASPARTSPVATNRTPTAPATPPATAAPMSNQDVIDLRRAGLDDDNLVAAVKDAAAVAFDLSPAGLKGLLTASVSNRVIGAMRARQPK